MEYRQITLTEWQDMKKEIERDLLNVKLAFVRIGYNLRKIEDQELYRQDGYKSIAEFAKAEYGLSASTVSRFMAINRRFSIGGNSQFLDNRYTQYSSSALQEMLTLPDHDMDMITPETKRETIRELKKFNAEAGEEVEKENTALPEEQSTTGTENDRLATENAHLATENADPPTENAIPETEQTESGRKAEATPLETLIRAFFKDNPQLLDRLYQTGNFPDGDTAVFREVVNPSGSRSVRSGALFLIMNESDIKYKRFGGKAETLSWEDFFLETDRIYAEKAEKAGNDNILRWRKEKAEETKDEKDKEKENENADKADENGAGGVEKIQDKGPETDRRDPGEHDVQHPEESETGGQNKSAGETDTLHGGEDQAAGEPGHAPMQPGSDGTGTDNRNTVPAGGGNTVAPAQKSGEEEGNTEEKPEEKTGVSGEENDLKNRLVNTANLLLSDLQHEDWKAAEHRLKFIKIWLEEIRKAE